MVRTADIAAFFDTWAPPSIAESWDTTGLIVGEPDTQVETIILTLDISDQTIDAARQNDHSMIIAHHPLIFTPVSKLSGNGRIVRLVRNLIRYDIAAFTAHTNLDQVPGGVSESLGQRLGLSDMRPLTPGQCKLVKFVAFAPPEYTDTVREAASLAGAGSIGDYTMCSFTCSGTGTFLPSEQANPFLGTSGELSRESEDRIEMIVPEPSIMAVISAVRNVHPYEEMAYDIIPLALDMPSFGYGAVGNLSEPLSCDAFQMFVCERLQLDSLVVSTATSDSISRVAVLGGSGSKFVPDAIRSGAEAFVTGDIDHHTFVDYGSDIMLLDANHDGTERPVLSSIQARLAAAFPDLTILIDQTLPPSRVSLLSSIM